MPRKLHNSPIGRSDMIEFINSSNNSSDFSFELRIREKLNRLGLQCEHSGTYQDPATNKPRQFDIRSSIVKDSYIVRMAIECKNLRDNFPLLVSTVPRVISESYHEIVYSYESDENIFTKNIYNRGIYKNTFDAALKAPRSHGKKLRLEANDSFYPVGEPVGKSCSQVGRDKDNNLIGNDSDIYEKRNDKVSINSSHNDGCI